MSKTTSPRAQRRPAFKLAAAGLTVAAALTVVVAQPASAYSTNGCRWGSATVTWQNGVAQDRRNGQYYDTAIASAWQWADKTDVNGMQPTGGSMHAFITADGANGWEGLTQFSCFGGSFLGADVTLNTYYADSYGPPQMQAVWIHEFGHGLGLDHSSVGNAIMWHSATEAYENYGTTQPATDDVVGMNSIY